MRTWTCALAAIALQAVVAPAGAAERVRVSGEIIDTWCYYSGVMGPPGLTTGTAHHTCALWCAAGGIPVGIKGDDGTVYMVLKLGDDTSSVANPGVLEIQSHQVKVDGDLYRRDGINYLLVSRVVSDEGIVNLTHEENGIQPFGE